MAKQKVRFGEQLVPLHGANPDDWALIYSHSYDYVLGHWTGKKGGGSSGSDNGVNDDLAGHGVSLGNVKSFLKVDRKECLDEAFVLLVLKNPSFETLGQARAWIAKTASNLYANEWSRAYRAERRVVSSLQREDDGSYSDSISKAIADDAKNISIMDDANSKAEELLGRKLSKKERGALASLFTGDDKKDMEIMEAFVSELYSKRGRQAARDS